MFDIRTALCRQPGMNPDDWFASRGSEEYRRAKSICAACPLQTQCKERALRQGEPAGVWGGLDELDRDEIWGGNRPTVFADDLNAALAGAFYYERAEAS